ncbi:MAG: hypothetical protein QOE56_1640, partial [Solirubrobacterales bacterium]|nr:hypothetical protein [Solirubrobacterales bacterium]
PPLGWDGQPPEPWEVGELQAKLRDALQPDPVRGIEEQPVIAMDSQMGQDLAAAGIRPLVVPHSYDIGSLLAACAERGWGAEIELPRGAIPRTPAMVTVCTRRDRGEGRPDEATYVGLERPVVALARAMIGALVGARSAEDLEAEGILIPPRPGRDELGRVRTRTGDSRRYDEYVIHGSAIGRGQKERVVKRMARQGWEVVVDEGEGPNDLLIFRRPKPLAPESETPEAAHH